MEQRRRPLNRRVLVKREKCGCQCRFGEDKIRSVVVDPQYGGGGFPSTPLATILHRVVPVLALVLLILHLHRRLRRQDTLAPSFGDLGKLVKYVVVLLRRAYRKL